jgi:hypothetical protein
VTTKVATCAQPYGRGIDVALIFDNTLFKVPAPPEESVFSKW